MPCQKARVAPWSPATARRKMLEHWENNDAIPHAPGQNKKWCEVEVFGPNSEGTFFLAGAVFFFSRVVFFFF